MAGLGQRAVFRVTYTTMVGTRVESVTTMRVVANMATMLAAQGNDGVLAFVLSTIQGGINNPPPSNTGTFTLTADFTDTFGNEWIDTEVDTEAMIAMLSAHGDGSVMPVRLTFNRATPRGDAAPPATYQQPYDPEAGAPGVDSWTSGVRTMIPLIRNLFTRHYTLTMPSLVDDDDVPLSDHDILDILTQSPSGPGDVWMDACTLLIEDRLGQR